jgi:hypothetical protein
MLFAAVHESGFGTKRTPRDVCLFVRFRGEADIRPAALSDDEAWRLDTNDPQVKIPC